MGLNEGNLFKEMPILLLFLNMLQEFLCFVAHTHKSRPAQQNESSKKSKPALWFASTFLRHLLVRMTLALSLAQIASIETKATTAKCVYILISKSAQNFSIEKCLFHASI